MDGETGVTASIIDDVPSWDIEGNHMGGESGVTRSIIDELHSCNIEGDQMEGKVVLFEVLLMNFIFRISN